jgi:ribosomal protein S27AE
MDINIKDIPLTNVTYTKNDNNNVIKITTHSDFCTECGGLLANIVGCVICLNCGNSLAV